MSRGPIFECRLGMAVALHPIVETENREDVMPRGAEGLEALGNRGTPPHPRQGALP
jgi:hypothetical protein